MAINVTRINPSVGFMSGQSKVATVTFNDTIPIYSSINDEIFRYSVSFDLFDASSGGNQIGTRVASYSKTLYGSPPPDHESYYGVGDLTITIPVGVIGTVYLGKGGALGGQRVPIVVGGNVITISFDRNGAGGSNPPSLTGLERDSFAIPYQGSMNYPGYTFRGWESSPDAISATYKAGDTWTFYASRTLYAVWKPNTYQILWYSNGSAVIVSGYEVFKEGTKQIACNTPSATLGYQFSHWETILQPVGQTFPETWTGTSITVNANVYGAISFKAVWTEITYSISYELNGATNPNHGNPGTFTVTTPTISLGQGSMRREGYTFLGWFTAQTGGTQVTSIAQGSAGNKTYYARWAINSYLVEFRNEYAARNGQAISQITQSATLTYGTNIVYSGGIPVKSVENNIQYTFIGWHTYKNATVPLNNLGVVGEGNITFYAIYKQRLAGMRVGRRFTDGKLGRTQIQKIYVGRKQIWEKPNND